MITKPADGKPGSSRRTCTIADHAGRCFLDHVGDRRWFLTDTAMRITRELPPASQYFLELDSDDPVVVCLDDGVPDPIIAVHTCFNGKDLYADDATGERLMVNVVKGDTNTRISLDQQLCLYVNGSCTLVLGSTGAMKDVVTYGMRSRRHCGQVVYFSMIGLYKLLNLKSYQQIPSKWANNGLRTWPRYITKYFPGSHFIVSKHLNGRKFLEEAFFTRCLPEAAMSCLAMVYMMYVFGFQCVQKGGFRAEDGRHAVRDVMAALVTQACTRTSHRFIDIIFHQDWKVMWPRPDEASIGAGFAARGRFELQEDSYIEYVPDRTETFTSNNLFHYLLEWTGLDMEPHRTPVTDLLDNLAEDPQLGGRCCTIHLWYYPTIPGDPRQRKQVRHWIVRRRRLFSG